MKELVGRLRRTPPRRLPRKVGGYVVRELRARARRWGMLRARGELSDAALLRALGGRFRSTDEVVAHLRARREPRFFVDGQTARRRAAALAARHPHLAARTRASAERALDHVVDLLGSGPLHLGECIDWHTDFKTGVSWPRQALYEEIDYIRLGEPCDVKVPWELSRCHQLVTLGRAYALDGDPRYAREAVAQLEAWLDANPWPRGVNWGRAMDVALRAINWLWMAALLDDAPELTDRVRLRLLKALLQHGRYILENLEESDNNGNHYLSNGVGLLYLGVLYPEFREAERWRRKGSEIVWGEIERQVSADGVDFEKGIGYQGLVVEFWYSAVLLSDLNAIPVPGAVRARLAAMFDFTLAYTRPDGTFPQIGDNDDGRLAGLDDEPVGSHRRHLAVAGAMLDRAELLGAAGDAVETAVWLLGEGVLDMPSSESNVASRGFVDGGFYVLRGEDCVMVVDAGEVGMNGIGGHGHNDLLSFDLWAAGSPLIVDPGTYVYTADPPARQWFRSTAAHNTLRVDGEEIARLGDERWLWRIEDDAHPIVHAWRTSDAEDVLDAEHDGYARLPRPASHRRRIRFLKRERLWLIEDDVAGEGLRTLELFFHPGVALSVEDGLSVRLKGLRGELLVVLLEAPAGVELAVEDGWVSRAYGHREPSPVLRYHLQTALPARFVTGLALVADGTTVEGARSTLERMYERSRDAGSRPLPALPSTRAAR